MRDAGRVKNRFEMKLDSNQVFSLFAGLAVYSALIFVLGVVVGRSRKPPEVSVPATVALPDASPTAVKRIEDRLAVAQPKATEEPEIPIGDVMTHLENATPANAVPTAKSTAKPAETARPSASATVARAETPKPVASPAVTVAKAETPKPVASPKTLLGEPTPASSGAKSALPPSSADGAWTLQVVAYNDKAQADASVAALKTRGIDAYAVTAQIPGKGTIHRVRVGRYATRGAAESAASALAAGQAGTKPLVVSFE